MSVEVEIKSLLGSKENAEVFRSKFLNTDPRPELVYKGKSINHYFVAPRDLSRLVDKAKNILPENRSGDLEKIVTEGKNISVRTRETESQVILVVKASVDGTTSSNGIARMEFEEEVNVSLKDLDKFLIDCGFEYQAKWSREREQYRYSRFNVCLDRNAGYGYLTEFELMVEDIKDANEAKEELRKEISKFGLIELDQARLARMFDFYNKHWQEYYGTEKTFVVE